MKHHYWTWPIAIYLFLGGLGGGMLSIIWALDLAFGIGGQLALPVFVALVALGLGAVLLVFELGQPLVFLRVFKSATAIIKWGAVLLSLALIFGFFYWLSLVSWPGSGSFQNFSSISLAIAGLSGIAVMIYTGVLLASLKAHAMWASPALPVLFTVSALSTGSAMVALLKPEVVLDAVTGGTVGSLLHSADIVLIILELFILLTYVLLLRGAGDKTAQRVSARWLTGSTAPLFWGGMIVVGLLVPLMLYAFASGQLAGVVAPVLVLLGGLLLRFLVVYTDDREPIPGEERFYARIPEGDERFITAWEGKENLY